MLNGAVYFNRYYSDCGQEYMLHKLTEYFKSAGVNIVQLGAFNAVACYQDLPKLDFVLFLDKDAAFAKFLEKQGIKVYNSGQTIEICDDKQKTYSELASLDINFIPTVFAPLMYDCVEKIDNEFLEFAVDKLGFPLIAKPNISSGGMGVHLIKDYTELVDSYYKLKKTQFSFQKYIETQGSDIRCYVVGKKVIAAVKRQNENNFISNTLFGGKITEYKANKKLINFAEKIAKNLSLDYGSVDFLQDGNKYYFLEANSNAYFKSAEEIGIEISKPLIDYIVKQENERKHTKN